MAVGRMEIQDGKSMTVEIDRDSFDMWCGVARSRTESGELHFPNSARIFDVRAG